MSLVLRRAAKALTPLTAAGVTAAFGYPAIATAACLIIFTLTAACWIINSNERTERLTRIILARHGNPVCLPTSRQPYNPPAAAERRPHTRRSRRPAAVHPAPHQSPRLPARAGGSAPFPRS
jgi:hypothetical protein